MRRLLALAEKEKRLVLGMMTGTSLDGLDLGLFWISGQKTQVKIEQAAFTTEPYPESLRAAIIRCFHGSAQEICRLNMDLGQFYASRALDFASDQAHLGPIDLVGSHGQTIWHVHGHSSLQTGEATLLAQTLGCPVVSDFRVSDISQGGSGAPLVPYLDRIFYGQSGLNTALLNLGGIGNVTYLPADPNEPLIAFDTGPANGILNEAAFIISHGGSTCDLDAQFSSLGKVDPQLLALLLDHPYFKLRPPKSTGRELFGQPYVQSIFNKWPGGHFDLLRNLVAFVAHSVALSFEQHLPKLDRLFVSGGGAHHPLLMADLKERLAPLSVEPLPTTSAFTADSKEAAAFALFAHERINSNPTSLPEVTGARRAVSMGKISLPD